MAILAAESYDARGIYVQHGFEGGRGDLYRIKDLLRIPMPIPPYRAMFCGLDVPTHMPSVHA